MSDSHQNGLSAGREALRRFLVGDDELNAMWTKLALIATEAVDGCDLASITVLREGTPTTPTFTDKDALTLDEAQYAHGDGPCLAAIRHRGIERVEIVSESRWPAYTAAAREIGVVGSLSVPTVRGEGAVGALNLYSRTRSLFDDAACETACLLADQLGLAARSVAAFEEAYELAQQLQQAMESRAVIEQAKGIIMAQSGVGPEDAFEILRRASQAHNRKLRAIANELVERRAQDISG